jgi:polysaccharide export outer membrane protein
MTKLHRTTSAALLLAALATGSAPVTGSAQAVPPPKPPAQAAATAKPAPSTQVAPAQQAATPSDYVIGVDDVLIVVFRREKDMTAEVVVRPDGKITLPLLNDIQAAGLTPSQLRDKVTEEGKRFFEDDPAVTIVVKQINSRKVFITGQISRPGPYPLGERMTVMQLISMAGGLTEYAKKKEIVIIREPAARSGGRQQTFRFNYEDIQKLRNLSSNIELKAGDTVIVP